MDLMTILMLLVIIGVGIVWPIVLGSHRTAKVRSGEIVLVDKTNTLAVIGFVLSFFVSVAAVILCHIALSQINRTRERGWGLAVAGLVLGYFGILAALVTVLATVTRFSTY